MDNQAIKSKLKLAPETRLKIYDLMVQNRVLEETLIKMFKKDQGYFWIGGPGEEAFNIPLGLLLKKGQGLDYDYLHGHYRSTGICLAMGMQPIEPIRQMRNSATDPYSGGRNFSSHYSMRNWNVPPITSPIEVQYAVAIGTGIAQRKSGCSGITIVTGGDAGTAEGDFASSLIWSSRPQQELPMLIVVTNNEWGISTAANTQHGEKNIVDRGKAFNIKTMLINGNDVQESYFKLQEAMDYVRRERKPLLLEARVSRLYGHSSASGANFHNEEDDPLALFETQLQAADILSKEEMHATREQYRHEFLALVDQAQNEAQPDPHSIYDHTYWQQQGKYW